MKKYLTLIATAIIFFSCKKENAGTIANDNPALSKTLYPLSFNFSVLKATGSKASKTATNSLNTTALKDQIKYLRYFVLLGPSDNFLDEFKPIKQKTQRSTDPDFGFITDSLPVGKYYIFFVGAQAPGDITPEVKMSPVRGDPIFYYNDKYIYDTFTKRIDVTITDKLDQSIVLNRVSAKMTVKLTDTMPANAAKIKVSFEDCPLGVDLLYDYGNPKPHFELDRIYPTATFSFPVNNSDRGKTGFTLSTFVWPFYYPAFSIDCFDLNDELIAHKELPGHAFDANTNYIFSGKLFSTQSQFIITINDKWDEPVNVPFPFGLPSATTTN
jgi:hypothetical protein